MRDTTANVGMTPTSKNSMAASAVATKTSGRQFEMPKIEFPGNLRELTKEAMAQTRGNYEQRNVQLLKDSEWFDIPIVYVNGTRAILAIEKGPAGDLAFIEALAAWERK